MGGVCSEEERKDAVFQTTDDAQNPGLRPAQASTDPELKHKHTGDNYPPQTAPAQPAGNTDYPIQPIQAAPTGGAPAGHDAAPAATNGATGWEIHDRPNSQLPLVSTRLSLVLPLKPTDFAQIAPKYANSVRSVNVLRNRATGDTYEGNVQNNVPHGYGKLITANGGVVEGFFENGSPADYIRRVDNTGKFQEGFFVNGAFSGKGYEIDATGKRTDYENYIAGKPEGRVTIRDIQTQRVLFDGTLKGGLKNGQVAAYYDIATKSTLQGNFVNDFLEGVGKRIYDNGQLYEGEFKKSVEDGKGSIVFADGRKWQGPFVNGKANGPGLLFPAGATTGKAATFKDGVKQA